MGDVLVLVAWAGCFCAGAPMDTGRFPGKIKDVGLLSLPRRNRLSHALPLSQCGRGCMVDLVCGAFSFCHSKRDCANLAPQPSAVCLSL